MGGAAGDGDGGGRGRSARAGGGGDGVLYGGVLGVLGFVLLVLRLLHVVQLRLLHLPDGGGRVGHAGHGVLQVLVFGGQVVPGGEVAVWLVGGRARVEGGFVRGGHVPGV